MSQEDKGDNFIAIYSSVPSQNYRLGRFQFTNGTLKFTDQAELDAFESLYNQLPLPRHSRIKKITIQQAESLVPMGNQTKQFDSSVSAAGLERLKGLGARLGTKPLEKLNLNDGDPSNDKPKEDEKSEGGDGTEATEKSEAESKKA